MELYFMRSAKDPQTIAAVMMAKVSCVKRRMSGIVLKNSMVKGLLSSGMLQGTLAAGSYVITQCRIIYLVGHEDCLWDGGGQSVGSGGSNPVWGALYPCLSGADEPEPVSIAIHWTSSAEAEGIAHHEPEDGDETRQCEGLHHGGKHILALRHAAIKKGQSWK
jgi:hypothetical protein